MTNEYELKQKRIEVAKQLYELYPELKEKNVDFGHFVSDLEEFISDDFYYNLPDEKMIPIVEKFISETSPNPTVVILNSVLKVPSIQAARILEEIAKKK